MQIYCRWPSCVLPIMWTSGASGAVLSKHQEVKPLSIHGKQIHWNTTCGSWSDYYSGGNDTSTLLMFVFWKTNCPTTNRNQKAKSEKQICFCCSSHESFRLSLVVSHWTPIVKQTNNWNSTAELELVSCPTFSDSNDHSVNCDCVCLCLLLWCHNINNPSQGSQSEMYQMLVQLFVHIFLCFGSKSKSAAQNISQQ